MIVIVGYGLKKGCADHVAKLLKFDNFIYPATLKVSTRSCQRLILICYEYRVN